MTGIPRNFRSRYRRGNPQARRDRGDALCALGFAHDGANDFEEQLFRKRKRAQPDLPALEQVAYLVAIVDRVVEAFLETLDVDGLQHLGHIADQFVLARVDYLRQGS